MIFIYFFIFYFFLWCGLLGTFICKKVLSENLADAYKDIYLDVVAESSLEDVMGGLSKICLVEMTTF